MLFLASILMACQEEKVNPNRNLTLDVFSTLKTQAYSVNTTHIVEQLDELVRQDKGALPIDRYVRSYYGNHNPLLWIDYLGADHRADSLLAWIEGAEREGLSGKMLRRKQIADDLHRLRTLNVDDADNDINRLTARLEYNLTRAFLRYCSVQQYGFLRPADVYNRLWVKDSDSVRVTYQRVFDIPVERLGEDFFHRALDKISHDSIAVFLREVQPQSKLYALLCNRLASDTLTREQRLLTLCNMERCRWREKEKAEQYRKHVVVNIPAFKLYAVDGDSTLEMRVGCGTVKTKTPLLTSKIMRMDINPQWILPKSIAKGIVHSTGYMHRNNMFIADRKLGRLDASQASYTKIMNGEQHIVQEGGPGNSLGRIIFRFENNFSVFLHDTNSPGFFTRDSRAVSHGCVRIQRPLDFAVFLLADKDADLIERLRYSMTANINGRGDQGSKDSIDRSRLLHQLKVEPEVPLFITYFTLYPDADGTLRQYPDVYGYDKAIVRQLTPYL